MRATSRGKYSKQVGRMSWRACVPPSYVHTCAPPNVCTRAHTSTPPKSGNLTRFYSYPRSHVAFSCAHYLPPTLRMFLFTIYIKYTYL